MQALLNYISGLNIPGAVLIFLPGWNLIFALHKYLKMHPQFGNLISPNSTDRLSDSQVARIKKIIRQHIVFQAFDPVVKGFQNPQENSELSTK